VLEHLQESGEALVVSKSLLKTNGTITVIEGDHGSVFFYPDSKFAYKAIDCPASILFYF
jgi:hypothetical protein